MMRPGTDHDGHDPAQRRRRGALAAVRHLRRASARLGALIDRIGPHRPIITSNPFAALIGSIVIARQDNASGHAQTAETPAATASEAEVAGE